jgi:apolipoprotein N-acyltransferase
MPGSPRIVTLARSILSAVSGVGVALAFPPYGLVWLMPFGLAGLMFTVVGCRGRGGFGQGLVFGLGFMLPLVRWVTIIGPDAWIALGLLEALFYGLMGMTWAWIRPARWWPLGVAATWVGAEALRSTVPFGGLPWGNLAFGLVPTPLVRYGRLGGTSLVAFVAVLAVALVVAVVVEVVVRHGPTVITGVLTVGALSLVAVSAVLPVGAAGQSGHLLVAAVQGNVPGQGMDPFAERRAVLNNHAAATTDFARQVGRGLHPQPQVVIWPENSTDIDPFSDQSAYNEIQAAVSAIGVPTLVGAVVRGPDRNHLQNMGIVWDPATGPGEEYVKRHLVPFGEYIPFRSLLTKYISRLKQIPLDFAPGTKDGVLQLGPALVADVTCFEVAYDELIRDEMRDGGQLLVVQTNNATYTGTGQLEQQFAISRYRAIETGRSVVIAATDGISGIIAPDGTVLDSAKERIRKVLEERVPLADGLTPGVRYGGGLKIALSVLGLGLAVVAYLGRRRAVDKIAP